MKTVCTVCGESSLFVEKAIYEGFAKVGSRLTCTACGSEAELPTDHEAPAEESLGHSGSRAPLPSIFSEDDRPAPVTIDGFGGPVPMCGHCVNYTVNAFTQRCGLNLKEVQATDSCDAFERRDDEG